MTEHEANQALALQAERREALRAAMLRRKPSPLDPGPRLPVCRVSALSWAFMLVYLAGAIVILLDLFVFRP